MSRKSWPMSGERMCIVAAYDGVLKPPDKPTEGIIHAIIKAFLGSWVCLITGNLSLISLLH